MKVLFVSYEIPSSPKSFPLGAGLLSAILKKDGHEVNGIYVHADVDNSSELRQVIDKIRMLKPGLICYSCNSPAFPYIKKIAEGIRCEMGIVSICGGAQATLYPEETLDVNGIDYICVGEGEKALPEFINSLKEGRDCSQVPGIWKRDDKGFLVKNRLYPLETDLDKYPWIDYMLFGSDYLKDLTMDGWLRYLTSRGCPYNCSYCHTKMFRDLYSERIGTSEGTLNYVRFKRVDSVIEELADIVGKNEIKVINFMDDLFCLHKKRTLEFCKKFKENLPSSIGYSIQTDLRNLDNEVINALYDSRCLRVVVGVESGSARILGLLNRRTQPEEMRSKLEMLVKRAFPLGTWTLNMIGNPTETIEDIQATIRLNACSLVERAKFNVMAPYQGSQIYEYCVVNDLFVRDRERQLFMDRTRSKLKFTDDVNAFLEKYFDIGHWYFNYFAHLDLNDRYSRKIKEAESIKYGDWEGHREYFLEEDRNLSLELRERSIPHYEFILENKVTAKTIGLVS